MRLICGIVRLDGGAVDAASLRAMFAAMGAPALNPAKSERIEGSAALGVLDFAPDARPRELHGDLRHTWMAADIRLNEPGTQPDEAVALEAYERWGEDLPGHLDGDFALAFWNPQERRLTLARDAMGVRPLCYTYVPGKFVAFASIPRGLHASGTVQPRVDLDALGFAQLRLGLPPDRTGWQGIDWLLPGHTLTISENRFHLQRGWRPNLSIVGNWKGSPRDAADELLHRVEQAVSARLRGTGPVAAHLSGGLDSSGIVVLAARKLRDEGRKLHAWSVLTHPSVNVSTEAPWVEAVLAQEPYVQWTPEYLLVDPLLEPLSDDCPGDIDLPLIRPNDPDGKILSGASATGASLLLSGVGGDEAATHNGSQPYAELVRRGKLLQAVREVHARAKIDRRPLGRSLFGRLILPFLPLQVRNMRTRQIGQPVPGDLASRASRFLNPALAARILPQLPVLRASRNSPEERIAKLTEGLDARANQWAIQGARLGIASSYPLADRRILEFCLSLPFERTLDSGYSRQPYRNAMKGVLPEKVRLRTDKRANAGVTAARIAAGYARFLPQATRLREHSAVRDLFQFKAIDEALRTAVRNASDPGLPVDFSGWSPDWIFLAAHASRALTIAAHIARVADSRAEPG